MPQGSALAGHKTKRKGRNLKGKKRSGPEAQKKISSKAGLKGKANGFVGRKRYKWIARDRLSLVAELEQR